MKVSDRADALKQFWEQLNQFNIHSIGQAPRAVQLTALALMILLIGVFAWLLLISPSLQKLSAAKSHEQTLIREFADKYPQTHELEALSQSLITQNTRLQQLLEQLPKSAPMTQIVGMINTKAQQAGVQVVGASVQAGTEAEYYTERPIAVRAIGSYHAIGRWLFELSSSPYLLTVHDVDIQASERNLLNFTAVFKTYQANKSAKPAAQSAAEVSDGGRAQ